MNSLPIQKPGYSIRTIDVAGSQNQQGLRIALSDPEEGFYDRLFLSFVSAPGHQNPILRFDSYDSPNLFREGWKGIRGGLVELAVSVDRDMDRIRPHGDNSFSILDPDHGHGVKVVQDRREEEPGFAVPSEGPVGDPAVHQQSFRPFLFDDPEKIGPEFRFRNHEEVRLQTANDFSHYPGIVPGKEESSIRLGQAFAGHFLPAFGSRGKHQTGVRINFPEFPDQRVNGPDFAQGNRVNPDPGVALHLLQRFPRKEPEFLGIDPSLLRGENQLGDKYGKRPE